MNADLGQCVLGSVMYRTAFCFGGGVVLGEILTGALMVRWLLIEGFLSGAFDLEFELKYCKRFFLRYELFIKLYCVFFAEQRKNVDYSSKASR